MRSSKLATVVATSIASCCCCCCHAAPARQVIHPSSSVSSNRGSKIVRWCGRYIDGEDWRLRPIFGTKQAPSSSSYSSFVGQLPSRQRHRDRGSTPRRSKQGKRVALSVVPTTPTRSLFFASSPPSPWSVTSSATTNSMSTSQRRHRLFVLQMKKDGGEDDATTSSTDSPTVGLSALSTVAILAGLVGIFQHWSAWNHFFTSLYEMKMNASSPEEFASAVNFWLLAAVSHPILQPIFWISEILHASPGPKVFNLIPLTFLLGTSLTTYIVVTYSAEIRKTLSIATLSAFLTYIGAGLDGQAGLSDYNIQLDDSYNGQIVKGCPSYDSIRQPSGNNFNLEKYGGRWYWHKVHDWTQFKEVYDTTLDIEIGDDGRGYRNKLTIKGPSPQSNPLSWDKSPLANGASYFWSGQIIDEKNDDSTPTPGVTNESGFGVKFPNYIIDIQTNPQTGQYNEIIQFQCIEVGNVRLYEGIDFMSRSPKMSDLELNDMHERAKKAGLYPYGASPEQMHKIERRDDSAGGVVVENEWQDMWRKVGVLDLLERLSESI